MEFYGSDRHKAVRKAAAACESNFTGPPPAGSKLGLEIWRVENKKGGPFGINKWPLNMYGSFYNGDSYICLKTYKKPGDDKKHFDLFFWLGAQSSIDERGVAAYKTVELDDFLDGKAKQYRLIEGNESEKFLACFKGAPIIMQGGIASGFRHVTKEKKADLRLLHIKKTRRKIRVMECAVDAGLVKGADVFVLDAGDHFFQWNGPGCSAFEKRRANEVIEKARQERQKRGVTTKPSTVIDFPHSNAEFEKLLGGAVAGSDAAPPPAPAVEAAPAPAEAVAAAPAADASGVADDMDDLELMDAGAGIEEVAVKEEKGEQSALHGAQFGGFTAADVQILEMSLEDGIKVTYKKVAEGEFGKMDVSVLKETGCYVIDPVLKDGDEIFIWIGHKNEATKIIRREAMMGIENYLATSKYPNTPVVMYDNIEGETMPHGMLQAFGKVGLDVEEELYPGMEACEMGTGASDFA